MMRKFIRNYSPPSAGFLRVHLVLDAAAALASAAVV